MNRLLMIAHKLSSNNEVQYKTVHSIAVVIHVPSLLQFWLRAALTQLVSLLSVATLSRASTTLSCWFYIRIHANCI